MRTLITFLFSLIISTGHSQSSTWLIGPSVEVPQGIDSVLTNPYHCEKNITGCADVSIKIPKEYLIVEVIGQFQYYARPISDLICNGWCDCTNYEGNKCDYQSCRFVGGYTVHIEGDYQIITWQAINWLPVRKEYKQHEDRGDKIVNARLKVNVLLPEKFPKLDIQIKSGN